VRKGKGYAGPKSSFESPHLPPKTLGVENRAKSFLEAYTSTQETLCARRERPAFHAGFQIDFISNFGNSIVRGLSFYSLIKFSCIYAMLKRYFQSVS